MYCKKCVDYCEFNAISIIPAIKHANIDASLCHSCGACLEACSHHAISESPQELGIVENFHTDNQALFTSGQLQIGSQMQTLMISKTKAFTNEAMLLTLYDSPPGTSCPVVETISDVNYVVLVTEPTPFGLHDLKLMVELVKSLKIPFGIIVNKSGLGDNKVFDYILDHSYQLLGQLPFDKTYAAAYADGKLLEKMPEKFQKQYQNIAQKIIQKIFQS